MARASGGVCCGRSRPSLFHQLEPNPDAMQAVQGHNIWGCYILLACKGFALASKSLAAGKRTQASKRKSRNDVTQAASVPLLRPRFGTTRAADDPNCDSWADELPVEAPTMALRLRSSVAPVLALAALVVCSALRLHEGGRSSG